MDVWTATRTILEKNPGLKRKFLLPEVREKTKLGHSAICEEWTSLTIQHKLYRVKGCYYLKDPELKNTGIFAGLLNHFDRRAEIKLRERQYEDQRQDKLLAEMKADQDAEREIMEMPEDTTPTRKIAEVKLKWRRKYGLGPG